MFYSLSECKRIAQKLLIKINSKHSRSWQATKLLIQRSLCRTFRIEIMNTSWNMRSVAVPSCLVDYTCNLGIAICKFYEKHNFYSGYMHTCIIVCQKWSLLYPEDHFSVFFVDPIFLYWISTWSSVKWHLIYSCF